MSEPTTERDPLEDLTSKLISVTEASEISGLTTGYIRRLLREGTMEGVKISRNWLTTEEALRKYLRTKRQRGRPRKN